MEVIGLAKFHAQISYLVRFGFIHTGHKFPHLCIYTKLFNPVSEKSSALVLMGTINFKTNNNELVSDLKVDIYSRYLKEYNFTDFTKSKQ